MSLRGMAGSPKSSLIRYMYAIGVGAFMIERKRLKQ